MTDGTAADLQVGDSVRLPFGKIGIVLDIQPETWLRVNYRVPGSPMDRAQYIYRPHDAVTRVESEQELPA